jgi:hypothetical protein
LTLTVVSGAVAIGMADYLDAEGGSRPATLFIFVDAGCVYSPRQGGAIALERPKHPGFTGPNKASAIGDKAVHRACDAFMFMSAGIDTVISGETSHVPGADHGQKA